MKRYIVTALAMIFVISCGMPEFGSAEEREGALTKTFNYDYSTCYWKVDDLLKLMPHVSVYAEKYGVIRLFYTHPNNTGVEVYFTAVDATHTKVEVLSDSSSAKNWIAGNIFSETVKPAESSLMDSYKHGPSKTRDW